MPLCLSSVVVRVTLDMSGIILTAAALGFLGMGAQPPMPEWGAMIASSRALHPGAVVGADDPGRRDLRRVARVQPARRRDARRARSAAALRMLVEIRNLRIAVPHRHRSVRGRAQRLAHPRPGEARHRRRIRLRQVAHRALDPAPAAVATPWSPPTSSTFDDIDVLRADESALRAHPRRARRADPAGPEILAESGDDRRRADRRGLARASRRRPQAGRAGGDRPAGAGADPRSAARRAAPIRTSCPAAWASA